MKNLQLPIPVFETEESEVRFYETCYLAARTAQISDGGNPVWQSLLTDLELLGPFDFYTNLSPQQHKLLALALAAARDTLAKRGHAEDYIVVGALSAALARVA